MSTTTAVIGTNTVNSISKRVVLPRVIDQIYGTNALFWRLNKANKRYYDGGTHIEVPFMYATWSNGGPYQGYDLLDVAPNDTIKNGAWDIKQQYVLSPSMVSPSPSATAPRPSPTCSPSSGSRPACRWPTTSVPASTPTS